MSYTGQYSIMQAIKQYMHCVNCILIDLETNYFMTLIMYKSPNQHITTSISGSPLNYVFHKQIHIQINETCKNIQGTPL